jgi:hypothetical protein
MPALILKRAPIGSNLEDYRVLESGAVVGRMLLSPGAPQERPWMWASGHNGDIRRAGFGHEPTREAVWGIREKPAEGVSPNEKRDGELLPNENPAIQGGVFALHPVLSLGVWELRIGRPALLRNLARRLIARSAAAGLWIGAARRAGHSGTARIGLAGSRWPLLVHWRLARCLARRLALRESDAA